MVEGGDGGWVGLVVGCFGLDLPHEDVACVDELVLVEGVMFYCCAVHPDCSEIRLDEETATREN